MSQHHPDQYPHQQDPMDPNAATTQFASPDTSQPTPKKKRGWLKWGGAAVGAFVVIGAFANMGSDDDAETTAAETSTTTAASETSGASAEVDTAETAEAVASETTVDEMPEATMATSVSAASAEAGTAASADADTTAESAAEDSVPSEYSSALREAQSYDRIMNMSKQGLYDQLTSEYGGQFTAEAAQYAVDNVGADWNANALEQAKSYQDTMNMSPSAVHDQLTSEYGGQFTTAQADYALANLGGGGGGTHAGGVPVEHSSALAQAETYANSMDMSKQGVYDQLVSEYGGQFAADAAQYAIDNVEADWNANALASARSYQDMNMSPAAIHDQLTSEYGGQFTQAQADYAIANL